MNNQSLILKVFNIPSHQPNANGRTWGFLGLSQEQNSCLMFILFKMFLRKLQTCFYDGPMSLYTHQQQINVPLSPHPLQHFHQISLIFLILISAIVVSALNH